MHANSRYLYVVDLIASGNSEHLCVMCREMTIPSTSIILSYWVHFQQLSSSGRLFTVFNDHMMPGQLRQTLWLSLRGTHGVENWKQPTPTVNTHDAHSPFDYPVLTLSGSDVRPFIGGLIFKNRICKQNNKSGLNISYFKMGVGVEHKPVSQWQWLQCTNL